MKKRFEFSVFNLTEETPAEIVKLQGIVKGLIGTVATTTWFTVSPELAGSLAVAGAIVIEFLGCFKVVNENLNY